MFVNGWVTDGLLLYMQLVYYHDRKLIVGFFPVERKRISYKLISSTIKWPPSENPEACLEGVGVCNTQA